MTQSPKLGALAVVPRNDKLLLVRRRNEPDAGLWGFPGGHVDLGETALDAAVRELQEETSVVADAIAYLTNIDVIISGKTNNIEHHFLLAAVLCDYRSGTPFAQDDASDAGWFDFGAVLNGNLPMSEHVDTVLRLAIRRSEDDRASI